MRPTARLFLLLLALATRLAVPSGFMIGPAGSSLALIPCPQTFEAVAPSADELHDSGNHGGHDGKTDGGPAKHSSSPCPYAAMSAPALPPTPALAGDLSPPPIAVILALAPMALTETKPLAAPPPPSRGPPVAV